MKLIHIDCAACGKELSVGWGPGVVPSKDYTLIADWIYCAPCFEKWQQDYEMYFHLGQLRHAYEQLVAGTVIDQKQFAEGLLGPAIAFLETYK